MYVTNIFVRRLNLNSIKVLLKPYFNPKFRLFSTRNKITSFNIKHQTENDVVLYELHQTRHFKYINIISLTQCAFWTNMGFMLHDKLKLAGSQDNQLQSFWSKILENEKYVLILSILSVVFGFSMLALTSFYTVRSITKLSLNKGGKSVTIITSNLPFFNKPKVIPLSQIGATIHRTKAKLYLPIKVKDKFFYYLIDLRGKFHHPELFDFTAGVCRNM